jgi:hypothetical protein
MIDRRIDRPERQNVCLNPPPTCRVHFIYSEYADSSLLCPSLSSLLLNQNMGLDAQISTNDEEVRSETTPLLAPLVHGQEIGSGLGHYGAASEWSEGDMSTVTGDTALETTPLPWKQLSVLLLLGAMQPFVYEIVFPFISAFETSQHCSSRVSLITKQTKCSSK